MHTSIIWLHHPSLLFRVAQRPHDPALPAAILLGSAGGLALLLPGSGGGPPFLLVSGTSLLGNAGGRTAVFAAVLTLTALLDADGASSPSSASSFSNVSASMVSCSEACPDSITRYSSSTRFSFCVRVRAAPASVVTGGVTSVSAVGSLLCRLHATHVGSRQTQYTRTAAMAALYALVHGIGTA